MDSLRTRIVALLTTRHDGQLTAEEIAAGLNKPVKQIRPRLTEMAKKGIIEKVPGSKVHIEGRRRSSGTWKLKTQEPAS